MCFQNIQIWVVIKNFLGPILQASIGLLITKAKAKYFESNFQTTLKKSKFEAKIYASAVHPSPHVRLYNWVFEIGFYSHKKSDFFLKKNIGFFPIKKIGFFPSKKIGFFSSKKIGFFPSKKIGFFSYKKIGFFSSKKIEFSQSDFQNPIVRSHIQQPKIELQRSPNYSQCIKLNLRGLNRHPDSKIDSQISKKMHKIYLRYPRII